MKRKPKCRVFSFNFSARRVFVYGGKYNFAYPRGVARHYCPCNHAEDVTVETQPAGDTRGPDIN